MSNTSLDTNAYAITEHQALQKGNAVTITGDGLDGSVTGTVTGNHDIPVVKFDGDLDPYTKHETAVKLDTGERAILVQFRTPTGTLAVVWVEILLRQENGQAEWGNHGTVSTIEPAPERLAPISNTHEQND
jgi:hypothetical protein